jgi:hypothetical protein
VLELLSVDSAGSCRRWSEFRSSAADDRRSPCDRDLAPSSNRPDLFLIEPCDLPKHVRDASRADFSKPTIDGLATASRLRGISTSRRVARWVREKRTSPCPREVAKSLECESPCARRPRDPEPASLQALVATRIVCASHLSRRRTPVNGDRSGRRKACIRRGCDNPQSSLHPGSGDSLQHGRYAPPTPLPSTVVRGVTLANPDQVERLEQRDS